MKSCKGKYFLKYLQIQGEHLEVEDLVPTGETECLKTILTFSCNGENSAVQIHVLWLLENLKDTLYVKQ